MTTQTIVTHNGGFHADDVFAVATVILSLSEGSEYSIVRTRDQSLIDSADVVVDVGGIYDPKTRRFDHHQIGGAGSHGNSIPFASFGLVWKEYGEKICGSKTIAHNIEQKIVMPIDAGDNGVETCQSLYEGVRPFTISDYLYSYWIDEHSGDTDIQIIFEEVVMLAKNLLQRMIDKEKHIAADEIEVLNIYEEATDKRVVVLPREMAWGRVLVSKEEPLFVVYPSVDGNLFRAKSVRKSIHTFEVRKQFPETWAGKKDQDLQKVSGVSDAVFCHNGRFIVVAKSLEGAIRLAYNALL